MKRYHAYVRTLHLYFGLFISPIVLIFSISVLVLNHAQYFNDLRPKQTRGPMQKHLEHFQVRSSDLLTAKSIIQELEINGEIDWITKTDTTFSFPVTKPGSGKWISLSLKTGMVDITENDAGIFKATVYLHTMPGPHNAAMRGNSFFMKVWRILTDAFVYIVLFLSVTGVFLWYFLKPERTLGIYMLAAGFILLSTLLLLLF